jgi:mannose-1-phosphate guanylyltransferase
VLGFREKVEDGTGLINGGVYVAEARAFDGCPPGRACSLERELIPALLQGGETVLGLVVEAPFVDIGLPEDYLRVRGRLPRSGDLR